MIAIVAWLLLMTMPETSREPQRSQHEKPRWTPAVWVSPGSR